MTEREEHKRAVRRAFDRAAIRYDDAAVVQREICRQLAMFAAPYAPAHPIARVLDAGCGTGYGLAMLAQRYPGALRIALDFAPAMLDHLTAMSHSAGAQVSVCADLEALPLPDASIDLAWSSLALQWCDPGLAFAELARVLRPGARAWVATLGPRTLWELRDAFSAVDEADHVLRFHGIEHWLREARGARLTVLEHDEYTAFALAPDLRKLLRDIKSIGAHSVGARRRRQPLGKAAWRTLEARYEYHRRGDGLLPASYDVILLALTRPEHPT